MLFKIKFKIEYFVFRPQMDPNVKGIPDFWYNIFRNVSMLCEMMQEHDEPILKCLEDIKGKLVTLFFNLINIIKYCANSFCFKLN